MLRMLLLLNYSQYSSPPLQLFSFKLTATLQISLFSSFSSFLGMKFYIFYSKSFLEKGVNR
ncbi:hypothetical protein ADM90_06315 [Lysinibacillus macroides]|uniref:Uncharacterized protein n=1 Tax=Lysinibacillus macroides TaxID=33935 RepID=A0A0N0CWC1_9BACI|nr:hypothetical protein ADM90_06315 [Lysinibacillus macroides]